MEANQPTDRQRLAAVLRTLADVLESEAQLTDELCQIIKYPLLVAVDFASPEPIADYRLLAAKDYAEEAAKLAGVEVAKAVGDA